jgi:hypothetical protein
MRFACSKLPFLSFRLMPTLRLSGSIRQVGVKGASSHPYQAIPRQKRLD